MNIEIIGAKGQTGTIFEESFRHVPDTLITASDRKTLKKDLERQGTGLIIAANRNPVTDVLQTIRDTAGDGSVVVLTQNGIEAPEIARTILSGRTIDVIAGSLITTATREDTGLVTYNANKLRVGLAAVMGPSVDSSLTTTSHLFKKAGFETQILPDYQEMLWTKLFVNMINFSAIEHRLPPAKAFKNQEIFNQELNAMITRLHILHAAGIKLVNLPGIPGILMDKGLNFPLTPAILGPLKGLLADWLQAERGGSLPAAARDMQAGKPTEARYYLKPWIDLGQRASIPSPLDEHLLQVVERYESNLNAS